MKNPHRYLPLLLSFFIIITTIHADGTVRIGVTGEFPILHPLVYENPEAAILMPLVYDELIRYNDKTGETRNILAKDYTWSEDQLELTIKLRRNVRFHNGKLLDAGDVVYSLNRYKENMLAMRAKGFLSNLKRVDSPGSYTVRLVLEEPNASSLKYINDFQIVPEQRGDPVEIGTGPYRLKKREGRSIQLEKNESYFLGIPEIEKIELIVFDNFTQLWASLVKGEIDYTYLLLPEDYLEIKDREAFITYRILSRMCYMIAFNLENPLFQNSRVRRALNMAVDREAIVEKCLKGLGEVCHSPIYPESWAYDPEVRRLAYDPFRALEILAEEGWEDRDGDGILDKEGRPFRFSVLVDKGDTRKKLAIQYIRLYLAEIGIEMRPGFVERRDLITGHLIPRKFESVFAQFLAEDPDFNYTFWHSSEIEGGLNCFSYANPVVDRSLEEGQKTLDMKKRKEAYSRFQGAFAEDPPGILLFYPYSSFAANRKIKGIPFDTRDVFKTITEWRLSPN